MKFVVWIKGVGIYYLMVRLVGMIELGEGDRKFIL